MAGGGNHRGSIFRLHVGTALLAASDWPKPIEESWSVGSNATPDTRRREYPLELSVSEYIGRMPFLWLDVGDAPGPESDRGVIETGSIALLSNANRPPVDSASAGWLGRHAARSLIRESGLWNVNHVRDLPSDSVVTALEQYVR